jgi:hypothetical protein
MANPEQAQRTIYLNHASEDELAEIGGLGREGARALVEAPFTAWNDVTRLTDLPTEAVSGLQSAGVQLGEPSAGPINEAGSGGSADAPEGNIGRA